MGNSLMMSDFMFEDHLTECAVIFREDMNIKLTYQQLTGLTRIILPMRFLGFEESIDDV